MSYEYLTVEVTAGVACVTMQRPEVHNALNAGLIEELRAAFEELGGQSDVWAIVLAGAGPSFCAGADVNWMQQSLQYSEEENLADARAIATMLRTIDSCPKPTIAAIHGAALGGGVGLAAICDLAIAEDNVRFGLTEIKLGIVPAVISPYVLRKVGVGFARPLFLTGERFSAARAADIGLLYQVVPAGELENAVSAALKQLRSSSPAAVAVAKHLLRTVPRLDQDEAFDLTTRTIARIRVSPEGQDGLRAFLEKRKAGWIE